MRDLMRISFQKYHDILKNIDTVERIGKVMKVVGLTVESNGPEVNIGSICRIFHASGEKYVEAEVVGFKDQRVLLMPLGDMSGIGFGSRVISTGQSLQVPVSEKLVGRILDALGNPMDGGQPIAPELYYPVDNAPPNPLDRAEIKAEFPLGIRAIDGLLTVGQGQRLGIFAGSGVGKSTLLGMIARNAVADVNVIVLVGERGREVKDFINNSLGAAGLSKSVLIVATSDQPALLRLKAAMVGTSIAEYFRDRGKKVLLLMDSLTRFAMAQREIGMAIGEPPISRGFPPSVYSILPKLLERSGNSDKGSITGLYTVLVEGDDMNEPISDTVRGILDGHIVLSRALATSNHYPAIDVLESISRVMKEIVAKEHYQKASYIKNLMAVYRKARDLIEIGTYRAGTSAEIDEAVRLNGAINEFLRQNVDDVSSYEEILRRMEEIR